MQNDYLALYRSVSRRYLHRRDVLKNLSVQEEDDYVHELDHLWWKLTDAEQAQINRDTKREAKRDG